MAFSQALSRKQSTASKKPNHSSVIGGGNLPSINKGTKYSQQFLLNGGPGKNVSK